MDVDDKRETKKAKKNPKTKAQEKGHKSNGRTSLRAVDKAGDTTDGTDGEGGSAPPSDDNTQSAYGTMDAYANEEDWTPLIAKILTVDHAEDVAGSVIYFLKL